MTEVSRRDAGVTASLLMAFGYRPVSMYRVSRKECSNFSEGYSIYSVAVVPNGHRHLENLHVRVGAATGVPCTGFSERRDLVRETRERILHQQYDQAAMPGRLLAVPGLYGSGV